MMDCKVYGAFSRCLFFVFYYFPKQVGAVYDRVLAVALDLTSFSGKHNPRELSAMHNSQSPSFASGSASLDSLISLSEKQTPAVREEANKS